MEVICSESVKTAVKEIAVALFRINQNKNKLVERSNDSSFVKVRYVNVGIDEEEYNYFITLFVCLLFVCVYFIIKHYARNEYKNKQNSNIKE